MELSKKIERYEAKGFKYIRDYNTGKHILNQCLIKQVINGNYVTTEIKSISNGKISHYSKITILC